MIKKGDKTINEIYKGDKIVQRVYRGGPNNLLLNSDFKNELTNWQPVFGSKFNYTTVDTIKILDGRNSVKVDCSGLTSNNYFGARQDREAKPGDIVTLSGFTFSDDLSTFTNISNAAKIQGWWRTSHADNGRIGNAFEVYCKPTKANEWQFFKVTSAPAPSNAVYLEVSVFVTRNGRIWFNGIKAETGSNNTPHWTPAPSEATEDSCVVYKRPPTPNLLLDSKFESAGTSWVHSVAPQWLPDFREENGITYCHPVYDWRIGQTIKDNTTITFTFSALVRNTGNEASKLLVEMAHDSGGKDIYIDIPANTNWHRIHTVISVNPSTDEKLRRIYLIVPNTHPYTIDVTEVKLEKGVNPYPEWTPAPSEVTEDIA